MDYPRPDIVVEQKFLLSIFSEVGKTVAAMSPPDSYSAQFKHRRTKHWSTWKPGRKHHYWILRRFFYYDYLLLDNGSYGVLVRSRPSREERRAGAFPVGFSVIDHLPPYELAFFIETTCMPLFAKTAKRIVRDRIADPGFSSQLANSLGLLEEWQHQRSIID